MHKNPGNESQSRAEIKSMRLKPLDVVTYKIPRSFGLNISIYSLKCSVLYSTPLKSSPLYIELVHSVRMSQVHVFRTLKSIESLYVR